jgi:LacI family gluconate utilization system Gnt-I transcriptional repressor
MLTPTLTTLRIPRYEIGRTTAHAILARLSGKASEPRLDLGFDILAREST